MIRKVRSASFLKYKKIIISVSKIMNKTFFAVIKSVNN